MSSGHEIKVIWKIGEKEKVQKRALSRGMTLNQHLKDIVIKAIEREKNASRRKR